MDDIFRNKWVGGVLVPCVAVVWGISSLVSREVVIPIRQFRSLPIYSHIPVHGWPAMLISVALISFGFYMHFGFFWSRYPKWERLASLASACTAWIAGILFAIGIFAWSIGSIADFWH
jgi:sterol desaturase/sphingolipid hydroxylase (fatty acid hydroxylase superfamily)